MLTSHSAHYFIFLLLVVVLHISVLTVNLFSCILIRARMLWKRRDREGATAEDVDRIKVLDATGNCVGGCCYHSRLNSARTPEPAMIRPAILFTHCNS